jgi:hypothetical protein
MRLQKLNEGNWQFLILKLMSSMIIEISEFSIGFENLINTDH